MRLTRTLRAGLIVIALAAALTSVAKAYTTYSSWGTLNVSFYVNPANLDVSTTAAISALQAGMSAWNTQSGTAFRFGYAGQVGTTTAGNDGRNVILFRNSTSGGTIASTYVWTSAGLIRESDIVFWDGGTKFFTGSSGCSSGAYIEDIASHELGHALGLQHSTVTGATMYGTYSGCSTGMRTLAPDDIAGAKALYADGPGEADTPPTVRILAPANGATVSSSTTVTFSGSATDTTDGDISSRLVWRSNISGQIGTGASFSRTLTAGTHTITATVTDSIGYTTTLGIVLTVTSGGSSNTAPVVTIISPANGATVTAGSAVTFTGSASDTQQGNLTSSLVWRSNLDGQIGTGGSFTRALTAGTHTITASATDSGGLTTQAGIVVTSAASPTNTAPSVTITSPANGATVTAGSAVTFTGSASDTQQGNLTSSLVWRSNLAGQIGTGGSFTRALTAGTHTITASVTDSGGLTTQRSITVYAVTATPLVSGKLAVRDYTVLGLFTVDLVWSGLSGTNVDVYRNSVKIGTTANDGAMTDTIGSTRGYYTYKVCAAGTSTCTNQASTAF